MFSFNRTNDNDNFPKLALLMLCEPIQSVLVSSSVGQGHALALSQHNTFLAYHYKHRQILKSGQLEDEIESLRKFVILILELIMCKY